MQITCEYCNYSWTFPTKKFFRKKNLVKSYNIVICPNCFKKNFIKRPKIQ